MMAIEGPQRGDDGVVIRDLATLDDYYACVALQDETWGAGFSERVPAAILRVAQKVGGVSAGAFDAEGRLLGFVFGLTGIRAGRPAHWSDMLAVRPEARGRHLGDRLKHYQRAKVRAIGVTTMLWTFDPLIARNAHFNINRLRARAIEYVPDMYGSNTGSTLHGALPTDRFIVEWTLGDDDANGDVAPTPSAATPGDRDLPSLTLPHGDRNPTLGPASYGGDLRIDIPPDFEAIQHGESELARRWRMTARDVLMASLSRGYQVIRFVRGHDAALPYYVLSRAGVTGEDR